MIVRGTRNSSGDGTAVMAATAAQRLTVGPFVQLQNKGAADVNVKLLLGATEIYDVLLEPKIALVLTDFPSANGGVGQALFVNLDAAVDVYYQIQTDMVTSV